MPVQSYFEIDVPRHAALTTSAGDHTRYVRMMAESAPYIRAGVAATPPLGWKSNTQFASNRIIAPIWGRLNAFIPNRR